MIFFKCLDDTNCGKKMTYLVDSKRCNMCGAPCEILADPRFSVKAPDAESQSTLGLCQTTKKAREGSDGCNEIAQALCGLSLEVPTEDAGVECSRPVDPQNVSQGFSRGLTAFQEESFSLKSPCELLYRPLAWMPDGVFGRVGMQQDIGPDPDLASKPAWPCTCMSASDPHHNNTSAVIEIGEINKDVDDAIETSVKTGEGVLLHSHDAEHYRTDTNVVLQEGDHDDQNEIHKLASEADPCSTETTPCPQSPDLPLLAVAEKLGRDEKDEKRRKAKAKKKARKEPKQADTAAGEDAFNKSASPRTRLSALPAPIAMLEKPEPVMPKSPTQRAWTSIVRKGRFTKETSMKGRKEANARSYLAREADEDEENEAPKAVELRFNVGGAKHDNKRVVPRHAIV